MNTYKTKFFANCPENGIRVEYDLTINTGSVVKVEDLIEVVQGIGAGLHEDIADRLSARFGGTQTLVADHHGVTINTTRPHLAQWSKPSESGLDFKTLELGPEMPATKTPAELAREEREWASFAEGRMG